MLLAGYGLFQYEAGLIFGRTCQKARFGKYTEVVEAKCKDYAATAAITSICLSPHHWTTLTGILRFREGCTRFPYLTPPDISGSKTLIP